MTTIPIPDRNKLLVRSFVDSVNAKDWLRVHALLAPNFRRHSVAAGEPGIYSAEELVSFLKKEFETFPDAIEIILDLLAERDKVAVRLKFRGTQLGPMGDLPATGKVLESTYLAIYRIENGLIAEAWAEWDNLAGFRQLGHQVLA